MVDFAPAIFGIKGLALSEEEGAFFHTVRPWGIILFARNIESPSQLRSLTDDLRDKSGNPNLPILIDQEGGRVARLKPPLVSAYPPMGIYGEMYGYDPASALEAARLGAALLAQDLSALGITINCAPCLDLRLPEASEVIGDRAFSDDVETVTALGRAVMDGLEMGGVLPVVKHLPGHGRAKTDSHHELPRIDTDKAVLADTDFEVFHQLNDALIGMTGHLLYRDIDEDIVSTCSKTVIGDTIRRQIGFDGLLMSDDISMSALEGDMELRVIGALKAGCDLVLHCNGEMAEMQAVAAALPNRPSIDAIPRIERVNQALAGLSCDVPKGARKVWGELMADIFPESQNAL
ncbi:MAG: beta-N-acetylhexosaminidase [Alphaproteobacteria bacterium]|nr:beta-N-acetylhexosaminidase [Alphaproteobacteria bacterium]